LHSSCVSFFASSLHPVFVPRFFIGVLNTPAKIPTLNAYGRNTSLLCRLACLTCPPRQLQSETTSESPHAARTVEDSIRAFGAYAREDGATVVLRIKTLPAGAEWIYWICGYKLFLQVLPAQHLKKGGLWLRFRAVNTEVFYFCVQVQALMSHCGQGTVNPNAFMGPALILFTQNTTSTTFSDVRSVGGAGAAHDLRSQGADPAVPSIRVAHSNGSCHSLEN
jgi:hypothetical protein